MNKKLSKDLQRFFFEKIRQGNIRPILTIPSIHLIVHRFEVEGAQINCFYPNDSEQEPYIELYDPNEFEPSVLARSRERKKLGDNLRAFFQAVRIHNHKPDIPFQEYSYLLKKYPIPGPDELNSLQKELLAALGVE